MDSNPAPTRRAPFTIRLAENVLLSYDELAIKHSVPGGRLSRADVLKAHLAIAARHGDEVVRLLKQIAEGRQ